MFKVSRDTVYPKIEIHQHEQNGISVASIGTRLRLKKKHSSRYYFIDICLQVVGGEGITEAIQVFQVELYKVQKLYRISEKVKDIEGNPVNEKDNSLESEEDRLNRLY